MTGNFVTSDNTYCALLTTAPSLERTSLECDFGCNTVQSDIGLHVIMSSAFVCQGKHFFFTQHRTYFFWTKSHLPARCRLGQGLFQYATIFVITLCTAKNWNTTRLTHRDKVAWFVGRWKLNYQYANFNILTTGWKVQFQWWDGTQAGNTKWTARLQTREIKTI